MESDNMELSHELVEAIKVYWHGKHIKVLLRIRACLKYSNMKTTEHPRPKIKEFMYCGVNLQELHCSDHAVFNNLQEEIKALIDWIALGAD